MWLERIFLRGVLVSEDYDWTQDLEDEECWYGTPECDSNPVIFLCSDGWICEPCYRILANVPDEIGPEMHDMINAQSSEAEGWKYRIQAAVDGEEDPDLVGDPEG